MRVRHVARLRTVGPAVPEDLPHLGRGRRRGRRELVPLHLSAACAGSSDCTDAREAVFPAPVVLEVAVASRP